MILSVLIPSVPSRHVQACALFDKITKQAEGLDVEVLMLCDNKKRSVGLKRQALVDISKGDYVAFVDDDDDVSEDYVSSVLSAAGENVGVIVFDTFVTLDDGPKVLCSHEFDNPNEQYSPNGFRRAAWQMHAWDSVWAKTSRFQDNTGTEDWPWCRELSIDVRMSGQIAIKIPKVLYHYRFNSQTTEASK